MDLHSHLLDETEESVPATARRNSVGSRKPPLGPIRPTRIDAEAAVRTLICWAGDDPARPGLLDTPARVVRAYEEWFGGYDQDPVALLERTFDEIGDYDQTVELHDLPFHSFCEHHMAAIRGKAHIAYMPVNRVVGISKLARVVEACARRLQIQERLTDDIARAIEDALQPGGVAVVLVAEHSCMNSRGVHAHGTHMVTKRMLGVFETDVDLRREFLASIDL
ncbi:GTP cyclohydrolase I FolE [Pseudaminobacter soli (ex Li et al. 2025)]|uniref:GTP cyclohydrolase 1 n=1 Tax=Pseudaminobacter soli (ex Li et al. 2025) TaxID=1295366 RepID=A0A2P7S2C0_9HYPH|nr:GTP cyclohydrolase I FolE [Mesorhizobium soli]PSJ56620.1 GTP cyclohydrolase I FolE [Mesorhizobium soli]